MSDSGMPVHARSEARNRHELRLVAASLAASFGIHAAALGLFPPVVTGFDAGPAPMSVSLRHAVRVPAAPLAVLAVPDPVDPATPMARSEPRAGIPARHVAAARVAHPEIPGRHVAEARPKSARAAVPVARPAASGEASVAAAIPQPPAPSRLPQHAEAANPLPATIVARKSPLDVSVAATTPPSFRADYLSNPPPAYPRRARRDGIEGTVRLKVWVTAAGAPDAVEIETSSGFETLDRAALHAVKGWQFVPARRGADRVDAWVVVPVVFRLESG